VRRPAWAGLLALLAAPAAALPAEAWREDPAVRDQEAPRDGAWDFNAPGGLPPGFAAELDVSPEVLRALVAQAIGADAPPAALELAEAPEVPVRRP
jgi:hypothetical protein